MMKTSFNPNTSEEPIMIILGILLLYILVIAFFLYLYLLNRITLIQVSVTCIIITIIYFPRLLIIQKLKNKDKIKVLDDSININEHNIKFEEIQDFKIKEIKPKVIFFINNNMVVYKEAIFYLKLQNEQLSFTAIGGEKIKLLKEFLNEILNRNK